LVSKKETGTGNRKLLKLKKRCKEKRLAPMKGKGYLAPPGFVRAGSRKKGKGQKKRGKISALGVKKKGQR